MPSPAVLGYSIGGTSIAEGTTGSPSGASTPDMTTAAAAMRWAACSHPSIAPLALPSPEHELTDPMRGVTVALPVDAVGRRTTADFSSAEEEDEDSKGPKNTSQRWTAYAHRSRSSMGRSAGRVIRNVGKKANWRGRGEGDSGHAEASGSGADKTSATRKIWEKFTRDGRSEEKRRRESIGRSSDMGDLGRSLVDEHIARSVDAAEGEGSGSGGSDETEREIGSLEDDGGGLHIPSEPREPPIQPLHLQSRSKDAPQRLRVIAVSGTSSEVGRKPLPSPRTALSQSTGLSTIDASPLPSPADERPAMSSIGNSGDSNGSGESEQTAVVGLGAKDQQSHLPGRSASFPSMATVPASSPIIRPEDEGGGELEQTDYFGLGGVTRANVIDHELQTGSSSSDHRTDSPSTSSVSGHTDLSASQTSSSSRTGASVESGSEASGAVMDTSMLLPTMSATSPGQAWSLPNTPIRKGVLNRNLSSPLPSRPEPDEDAPATVESRNSRQFLQVQGQGEVNTGSSPRLQSRSSSLASQSPTKTHNKTDNAAFVPSTRTEDQSSRRSSTSSIQFYGPQDHRHIRLGSTVSNFAAPGGKGPGMPSRPALNRAQSMKAVGSAGTNLRVSQEEEDFVRLGYLAPPYPKDEEVRRRALYKFNAMHTVPDVNFDRIAYLTKLVFSTKIVVISLVDGTEEWYKMECRCALCRVAMLILITRHSWIGSPNSSSTSIILCACNFAEVRFSSECCYPECEAKYILLGEMNPWSYWIHTEIGDFAEM